MSMTHENVIDRRRADLPASAVELSRPATACLDRWNCDPLEPDAIGDEQVTTSRRRLLRLAIAAVDVAARFTRDHVDHDPVAWMMAPRRLFGWLPGVEACQDLHHFNRNVIMHGLGLGLDADPGEVDALLAADDGDDGHIDDDWSDRAGDDGYASEGSAVHLDDGFERYGPSSTERHAALAAPTGPQLLTCWVDAVEGSVRVFAFCAVVSDRHADIVERVAGRFGVEVAARAHFATGYDHTTPMAAAMISDAMAETLALAASAPASPLALGLDVLVEQRFANLSIAA